MSGSDQASLGSVSCVFGEIEAKVAELPGFEQLWQAQSPGADFSGMGCGSFRKLTGPAEDYVIECIRQVLAQGSVPAGDVGALVLCTTDACLALLTPDLMARVLAAAGLVNCVPTLISFQQCCASITALGYAWQAMADPDLRHAVLISLDFTPDDADRVRSFAFFGDAVAGCLISRDVPGEVRLLAAQVTVDHLGLTGRDSFVSRQAAANDCLTRVFSAGGGSLDTVAMVFPTNLYLPLTVFNASILGLRRDRLHFTQTLAGYAHCGNADWLINLADYRQTGGFTPGERYLAQASAPGFFAAALLAAC